MKPDFHFIKLTPCKLSKRFTTYGAKLTSLKSGDSGVTLRWFKGTRNEVGFNGCHCAPTLLNKVILRRHLWEVSDGPKEI